jgi:hypothetical protein
MVLIMMNISINGVYKGIIKRLLVVNRFKLGSIKKMQCQWTLLLKSMELNQEATI